MILNRMNCVCVGMNAFTTVEKELLGDAISFLLLNPFLPKQLTKNLFVSFPLSPSTRIKQFVSSILHLILRDICVSRLAINIGETIVLALQYYWRDDSPFHWIAFNFLITLFFISISRLVRFELNFREIDNLLTRSLITQQDTDCQLLDIIN